MNHRKSRESIFEETMQFEEMKAKYELSSMCLLWEYMVDITDARPHLKLS